VSAFGNAADDECTVRYQRAAGDSANKSAQAYAMQYACTYTILTQHTEGIERDG